MRLFVNVLLSKKGTINRKILYIGTCMIISKLKSQITMFKVKKVFILKIFYHSFKEDKDLLIEIHRSTQLLHHRRHKD